MPELPKVPAEGVIETYDTADALGMGEGLRSTRAVGFILEL
jgi:hypothetical protein